MMTPCLSAAIFLCAATPVIRCNICDPLRHS
jgi:hypothetical protein